MMMSTYKRGGSAGGDGGARKATVEERSREGGACEYETRVSWSHAGGGGGQLVEEMAGRPNMINMVRQLKTALWPFRDAKKKKFTRALELQLQLHQDRFRSHWHRHNQNFSLPNAPSPSHLPLYQLPNNALSTHTLS